MKINKLKLKNFRSYEDETTFDFSTTDNKNIVLIGGKNGAGKSTIFEGIKLCIYGPIAYKYQGFNSSYIAKVKSTINNNAFKNDIVDSYVSIDIEITEQTEKNIYTLIRKWTFTDTKLDEVFTVYKNFSPIPLDSEDLNYFENYLRSIISPKIFDFFFFDGEHLSEFFIGKNSNIHLKQALLSLCNYDTFDVLKSTIITNSRTNKNDNDEIDIAKENYSSLEDKLMKLTHQEESLVEYIEFIESELEDLVQQKKKTEDTFRKQGGLLAEERENLNRITLELENARGAINQNVKDFCNDMLPFLIIKSKFSKLKSQVETENKHLVYSQIKNKLNEETIMNILQDKISSDVLNEVALTISEALTDEIKPKNVSDDFETIHMLSNDESNHVLSSIDNILGFDNNNVLNLFREHRAITEELASIRSTLNSSLEDRSLSEYIVNITNITSEISSRATTKYSKELELEQLRTELNNVVLEKEKAKKCYADLLQTNNIVDMSANLIAMLDDIISDLTKSKLEEIKDNFMYIFRNIIRKNNFIDHIDIDNNFNVTLYINRTYNSTEIENMLENMGYDEMEKKLGRLFFEDLFNEYTVNNKSDLLNVIKNNLQTGFLDLKTKVDVNVFSSGEKQIYILCLYWALIKASGVDIPFIIDTPYARIDENHRNNITSKYFSTISKQVVILSTNTEIDLDSYKEIKPNLSNEYLIEYDDFARKTTKTDGYFFEV
jgi:DNA sulfur modification protein DndD